MSVVRLKAEHTKIDNVEGWGGWLLFTCRKNGVMAGTAVMGGVYVDQQTNRWLRAMRY